jgi:hypothetical protein
MAPYEYKPLASGKEIRLLQVLPGRGSGHIEIEIFIVDFEPSTPPEYEALSYTWGSTNNRRKIKVHHGPREKIRGLFRLALQFRSPRKKASTLAVTRNLESALRHLRLPDKGRILWIDAICINQNDFAEQSAEVSRMGTIYGRASQVIVWLGSGSEDSTLAMGTLHRIGQEVVKDEGCTESFC